MRTAWCLCVVLLSAMLLAGCAENDQENFVPETDHPQLRFMEVTVESEHHFVGDNARLDFRVMNTGREGGSFAIQLLVDGRLGQESSIRLGAGAVESGFLEYTFRNSGTYTLQLAASVLGEQGEVVPIGDPFIFEVKTPLKIEVTHIRLSSTEAQIGTPVTVYATVQNHGETGGEGRLRLFVGSEVVQEQTVMIGSLEAKELEFVYESERRGTHLIKVEDSNVVVLEYYKPATFVIDNIIPGGDNIAAASGSDLDLMIQVRNIGDRGGTARLTMEYLGAKILLHESHIGPDAVEQVEHQMFVDHINNQEFRLLINDQVELVRGLNAHAPELEFVLIERPYMKHGFGYWNCGSSAYTTVAVNNVGLGNAQDVQLRIWYYEQQVGPRTAVTLDYRNADTWHPAGFWITSSDLDHLEIVAAGSTEVQFNENLQGEKYGIKIDDVEDVCGSNDCHDFVFEIHAKFLEPLISPRIYGGEGTNGECQ